MLKSSIRLLNDAETSELSDTSEAPSRGKVSTKRLKDLATNYIKEDDDRNAFEEEEFESLKTKEAKSTSNTVGKLRKYGDLIKGRFELTKIKRIERQYDPNTSTSFKGGDITPETIDKLIKEGERDGDRPASGL